MEQKKLDFNSIIGFILILGILFWIMYQNAPNEKEIAAEKAKKEQLETAKKTQHAAAKQLEVAKIDASQGDSTALAKLRGTLGGFAYSATLPSANGAFTTIENKLISLKIANKGGYIVEAKLKKFARFHKNSGELVSLIKDNNAHLNIRLQTNDNRVLDTKNLYFEPTLTKSGENQILTMRLKAGSDQYLEYKYVLKADDYMLDFDVRSQGLSKVLNTSKPLDLEWDLKAYRNEPSVDYERRYAEIVYEYEDGKDDYMGQGKDDQKVADKVSYIAFKQHFFTSILLTKTPFEKTEFITKSLVHDSKIDTTFTEQFRAKLPLAFNNGEIDYKMNWYYGPADYKLLSSYDRNLDEIIPLGWGIF